MSQGAGKAKTGWAGFVDDLAKGWAETLKLAGDRCVVGGCHVCQDNGFVEPDCNVTLLAVDVDADVNLIVRSES